MPFQYEVISCQNPKDTRNIIRNYLVVKAIFKNNQDNLSKLKSKAWNLAQKVNPHKANNSTGLREKERLILDAMGGVLSESAWFHYINRVFGDGTVTFTEFNDVTAQIDLKLSNGKTIEIRSSFPRNGVKFAMNDITSKTSANTQIYISHQKLIKISSAVFCFKHLKKIWLKIVQILYCT